MKSIIFGLSLVGAVVAQYASDASVYDGGASASATDSATDSASGSYPVAPTPAPTTLYIGSYVPPSAPTPTPTDFYQYMPYSAYQSGGYKSLECGYGYSKQDDGSCSQDSWVCFFF